MMNKVTVEISKSHNVNFLASLLDSLSKNGSSLNLCMKQNINYGCERNMLKIFCRHKWIKVGGPNRAGQGKFSQRYRCRKCNKSKTLID